jgi:hypothetical protein
MIVNHGKMGGHKTLNQQVPGSIPGRPTSKFKHLKRYSFKCFFVYAVLSHYSPTFFDSNKEKLLDSPLWLFLYSFMENPYFQYFL